MNWVGMKVVYKTDDIAVPSFVIAYPIVGIQSFSNLRLQNDSDKVLFDNKTEIQLDSK